MLPLGNVECSRNPEGVAAAGLGGLAPEPRPGTTSRFPLLPWVFALGILVNHVVLDWAIGPLGPSFFVLTLVNVTACLLLVKRLTGPVARTLWVWPILVYMLIGYFFNATRFALHLNAPGYINTYYPELRWVTRERIIEGYPWTTLGFVTFCIVASAALRAFKPVVSGGDATAHQRVAERRVFHVMVAAAALFAAVTLVQVRVGYGVLGASNPSLPFRAGSFITLYQRTFAPVVLLLAVWVFDSLGGRRANLAALLVVGCGVLDSYASTSRGTLLGTAAPVFFLWLLTKRFTPRRKAGVAALLLVSVALFPVLSTARSERLTGEPGSTTEDPLPVALVSSALNVVTRVGAGGADGLWPALDHRGNFSIESSGRLLLPGRLGSYFTQTVVGVRTPNDFRTPGVLASLVILGAAAGVVAGIMVMVPLCGLLWARVSRLRTAPVSLALAVTAIVVFFQSLDAVVLVKLLIQVCACEFVYRKVFVLPHRDAEPAPAPAPAPASASG